MEEGTNEDRKMKGQFGNGWLSINQDLKGIIDNNGEYD